MADAIEPGLIVEIHSLQSAAGRKLNGLRGAVLREVPVDGRFEIVLEDNAGSTKAIKRSNLKVTSRLTLPDQNDESRGTVTGVDEGMYATLCELLVWYRDKYQPSDIMFMGYASMAFSRMGQQNFMFFVPVQMEQMGGVLALSNLCEQGDEDGTSGVLFALLEGDTMYMEVVAQTIYWTGFIGPEEANSQERNFSNCPPTKLTPDQEHASYVRCMSEGPVKLLLSMTQHSSLSGAFYAAMARHCQFFHLLVHRLLRWVAREALKTPDGLALGRKARKILVSGIVPQVVQEDDARQQIASLLAAPIAGEERAKKILDHADTHLDAPSGVTTDTFMELLLL